MAGEPGVNTAVDELDKFNAESIIVIVCTALGLYNALELLLLIYLIFKRKHGLYYWSMLIATFGLIPYSVGRLMVYFGLSNEVAAVLIDNIGWMLMVSGQSFVLYSRLHLVLHSPRILRVVLWIIILDAVILHTTTTVVSHVSNLTDTGRGFADAYKVIEKIQMTIFCMQELGISGLYVWKTVDILRTTLTQNARNIMKQLFGINVLIILMDIALLALEYRNVTVYQQSFKGVVYSVKLKLEFAVLNQLVEVVRPGGGMGSQSTAEGPEFADLSRSRSDLHAEPKPEKHHRSFWYSKQGATQSEKVTSPPESPSTQDPPFILGPTFSPIRTPAGPNELEEDGILDVSTSTETSKELSTTRPRASLESEDADSEQMYMRAMRQISHPQ
ncbi:hypothetical protein W97_08409 [Coniosporium apollinis CBS 100218]|uniref:DUF7703 domain-containing protein n=1 Tax=Coniosporium apollinis (strain CBS 100218) TaxID=1168221 RepID=R7Z5C4_CONA1|nr:uncharacterized protein W97_08409 [Coniosporium apollinis CBS 100218]EON69096.1 hypothetical protein W97_08409 [Coniosporium apollinis CBS 100218]